MPRLAAHPLLEREDEIAALRAAAETVSEGHGGLVIIEASAGIGKTRLLSRPRSGAD